LSWQECAAQEWRQNPAAFTRYESLTGGSQAPKRRAATRSSAARDVGDARRRRLSTGCSSPAPDGPASGASRERLPLVRATRVGEDEYSQKACAARRPGAPRGRRARCESVVGGVGRRRASDVRIFYYGRGGGWTEVVAECEYRG
jgi:hypothetical protein